MIYVAFERGDTKFLNILLECYSDCLTYSRVATSFESKMATMQHKNFCVLEFIKIFGPELFLLILAHSVYKM